MDGGRREWVVVVSSNVLFAMRRVGGMMNSPGVMATVGEALFPLTAVLSDAVVHSFPYWNCIQRTIGVFIDGECVRCLEWLRTAILVHNKYAKEVHWEPNRITMPEIIENLFASACRAGKLSVFEWFNARYPDLLRVTPSDFNRRSHFLSTVVQSCCESCNISLVKRAVSTIDKTCLASVVKYLPLNPIFASWCRCEDAEGLAWILDNVLDTENIIMDETRFQNFFGLAYGNGCVQIVSLVEERFSIPLSNYRVLCLVFLACKGNHLPLVQHLFSRHCLVDKADLFQFSFQNRAQPGPLSECCRCGNVTLAEWLTNRFDLVDEAITEQMASHLFNNSLASGSFQMANWAVSRFPHAAERYFLDFPQVSPTPFAAVCSPEDFVHASKSFTFDMTDALAALTVCCSREDEVSAQAIAEIVISSSTLSSIPALQAAGVFQNACVRGKRNLAKLFADSFSLRTSSIIAGPFTQVCGTGQLHMAQWITERWTLGPEHMKEMQFQPLFVACTAGHLDLAQWLVSHFVVEHVPIGPEDLGYSFFRALVTGSSGPETKLEATKLLAATFSEYLDTPRVQQVLSETTFSYLPALKYFSGKYSILEHTVHRAIAAFTGAGDLDALDWVYANLPGAVSYSALNFRSSHSHVNQWAQEKFYSSNSNQNTNATHQNKPDKCLCC
ncbi:hypothetical protein Pelo_16422 [Pelomyxa schiedti]|nr:hypothetical protein Pelo_16422 [Pelomyxa schiedti]